MCSTHRQRPDVSARLSVQRPGRVLPALARGHSMRLLGLVRLCLTIVSCATPQGSTIPEQRAAVRQMQQATLAEFYAAKPDRRVRLPQAAGYGVFSNQEDLAVN